MIAPQVEQVVLKALAKDPQQRFPSIEAFSTALEQALLPPLPGWNKKHRDDMDEVVALVHRMYEQVLSRRADESGLITYGAMLYRGEKSVREIVKILGLSPEYRKHFITPFVEANEIEVPLEVSYERFLGRNAGESEQREYTRVAQTQGFDTVIDALIESEEYKKSFGEDDLPPTTVGLAVASRWPNHLECFYRGKDNHLQHRWWYGSEWSGEGFLGGILTSAPATISWGGDRIDCFYRGQGGHLYYRWWDGSRWSDPRVAQRAALSTEMTSIAGSRGSRVLTRSQKDLRLVKRGGGQRRSSATPPELCLSLRNPWVVKDMSSPSEKHKWLLLSACHAMRLVESCVSSVLCVFIYDRMR